MISDVEHILCTCWPFVYFLWKINYSGLLPIYTNWVLCVSFFFFFPFGYFRAALTALGGSQSRGQIRAVATQPMPQPKQLQIRAVSATYTTPHGNAGSLTRWARPGIEPAPSWILVGFVNHWATTGIPGLIFWCWVYKFFMNFGY